MVDDTFAAFLGKHIDGIARGGMVNLRFQLFNFQLPKFDEVIQNSFVKYAIHKSINIFVSEETMD